MTPSKLSIAVTAAVIDLLCLCSLTSAQIVSCDSLDCSTSDNPNVLCPLTDGGVGTTSFESSITTDGPLTWTIAGTTDSFVADDAPKDTVRIAKNFYLGTPQSLQFSTASNFHGCSFVYWDITSDLQTPAEFDDLAEFGCNTVMTADCASDLLSQVEDEMSQRALASDNTACVSVMDALQQREIPESCRARLSMPSWGRIDVDGRSDFLPVGAVVVNSVQDLLGMITLLRHPYNKPIAMLLDRARSTTWHSLISRLGI
jgi:hypothetical protein